MPTIEHIQPAGLPDRSARYSPAVKFGDIIWVSGMVAANKDGELVGEGDPAAQAKQAYANLITAVEAAGGTAASVVKQVIYTVDRAYGDAIMEMRSSIWPAGKMPATTLIIVAGLGRPEVLMEIECVAIAG